MRAYAGEADWEGIPLSGCRNLSPDFYNDDEQYIFEDETAERPSFLSPGVVEPVPGAYPETVEPAALDERLRLGNETLPIYAYREKIVEEVRDNPFVIIKAETGAGKSTQVAQFLHEAGYGTIFQTQPRRAAARNVYLRIKEELGEKLGKEGAVELTSYRTAGERDGPDNARIRTVTDGLQLAVELDGGGIQENDVVIIDEIHEANCNIDFLIAVAQKAVAKNPNLRFVLMSATSDDEPLVQYLSKVCEKRPPIINVPGRTYNVERSTEPESTVANQVVKAAEEIYKAYTEGKDEPNGILTFVAGKREIDDTIDALRRMLPKEVSKVAKIFPLHSKLSVAEQQAALKSYDGVKIIVSTNLAQTSLTIPDIKWVIDSGEHRRMELDIEGGQGLVLCPISQADIGQRAGRAGRVSDGYYILTRMDKKSEFTPYEARDAYPTPEILRTDIARNTLRIANAGFNLAEYDLPNPVDKAIIERAQNSLRLLGALDENNVITDLGRRMNEFPVYAPSARMMVESERYSERTRACMAAIAASKEVGGLQYFAHDVGKRWQSLTEQTESDLLAQLDIFIATQGMDSKQLREYDLDVQNIERAREQYRKMAKKVHAVQDQLEAPTFEERQDIKQCIYVGSVNSMFVHSGSGYYTHLGSSEVLREISDRSVVHGTPDAVVADKYRVEYYKHGVKESRHILEHVTVVTLAELGRVARHLTEWPSEGLSMRGGTFVDVRRQHLFGVDLGVQEEVIASASPKLREALMAHVVEHPGPNQVRIRAIKKELEKLAHLAKDPVKQLTHDYLLKLIDAATVETATDPWTIDNNLGQLIDQQKITLDSYISQERRDRIKANAPATIVHENAGFKVVYRNSTPLIRSYHPMDVEMLTDEIFLSDGRQVYFVYEGKRKTLIQLQETLGTKSYI